MGEICIREARADDVPALTEIQNALIATTSIEWRDDPHTVESRAAWLDGQRRAGFPVLVATEAGEVVGFASFGHFRDTEKWPGYRYVAEHTVHVRESHWGSGVGRLLMDSLVESARRLDKHVLVAAVDAANEGSVRFHERLGFEVVGRLPQIGAKHGRWLDLVLLQLQLDDRPAPPGGHP